jgi:predicted O-methyltransferase YrrM
MMKNIKMIINDTGIHPIDKPKMFFALNEMGEYYNGVADLLGNGDILEIGFGMGICSSAIQNNNPKSHTIIEINQDIFNYGLEWANSKDNVKMILGDWKDVVPTLNKKYDSIFIDTIEDGSLWDFERYASMVSKVGTILSMYNYKVTKNTNIYAKKINGAILNWSVYNGNRFTTEVNKSKLI